MKKVTLILLASFFTFSCFAQKLEWNLGGDGDPVNQKNVHIQFMNQHAPNGCYYFVVTANFGHASSNYLQIDRYWFFENSSATRNLIGELQWKNTNHEVIAVQRFYKKNVNYHELINYTVNIELGPLEYLHTHTFDH